ncbi:cysteine desulfurase family protein [Magnetospirillum aberrantis]|uniref:Cysteine desulfurase n=1 Tax=Magnetospirillum aberrantis SpK TaxID=908842 RepID=A0A7C9QRZ5_9PROT|nr:cysteine desulfurase family protein [Magnetospirillum aberrantis]NFV79178.1 cysteine desulfurase [Magnetospirillum aberrantis SpK]
MSLSRLAYLDCNAGAPARPEVVAAMAEVLAEAGNPSSVHGPGRRARARLEEARGAVALAVGARAEDVVFTSGGTEANNLALRGCGRRRLLVSAVEHPSVREAAPDAEIIPVDGDGVVDLAALERLLAADGSPALVSVMLANNETGGIQPVAEVARIAHSFGALVHCDAAQALGKMSVSLSGLCVDFLTLSAHKLAGPAGIGALVVSETVTNLAPILRGGGQERRRRAGSENLAGAVGFGVAVRLAAGNGAEVGRMKELRDRLETAVLARVPGAVVVAGRAPRLDNTSCVALPGVPSQVQVMALDLANVAVSAGSACSSGKVGESAVLRAMGLDKAVSGSAIRVSLGWCSVAEDVEMFLSAWCDLARRKGFEVRDAAEAA